ncbi:MAG: hypothetical protein KF724_05330 [Phycisphaeraceae bacterium]|nr:hypothetical protein [Phycisphaeraceae bacterium]
MVERAPFAHDRRPNPSGAVAFLRRWAWLLLVPLAGLAGCRATSAFQPPSEPAALTGAGAPLRPIRTLADARADGVRWLIENQNPDGSFGTFASARPVEIYLDNLSSHRAFHVATSALATWSLVEPARDDPKAAAALDRALDWIIAAPPTGRATGSTFYDTWAHTYLLDLAAAVLADPRLESRHEAMRALAEREVLLSRERQSSNGGWGYYDFGEALVHPSGHLSTSFNTAAMILALRAVERQGVEVPAEMIRDGMICLRRMQQPDGAWAYGIYLQYVPRMVANQPRGASGRLQVCNLAMYIEDAGTNQSDLAAGLQLLRDHHHYIAIARGRVWPHEAWYANSGYYYFFGHFYAALVAVALDEGSTRRELAEWLAGVLIADQNSDGSWFDFPLYGYGHAYATGYAMLSLNALRPLIDESRPLAEARP